MDASRRTLCTKPAHSPTATGSTTGGLTEALAEEVPDDVLLVSESGIKTPADAMRVLEAGANAVLIGEALMRAEDPTREVEAYLELELS